MKKDPAFLLYSKDWLEGTAEYMPDEKGVYIDLLCHQHQKGSLPTDLERLARMVGLSQKNFQKIWKVIAHHFKETDNRLVNRKLNQVMTEREEKGKVNTIIGTFAGMLRLGNYDAKEYKYLKSNFKASEFTKYKKEEITERLTEWLVLCLKSIEDANKANNKYNGVLQKVLDEYKISLPDKFEPLVLEWLKYKSQRGESYKEIGLKNFLHSFLKESNSNANTAMEMLKYSTSNNYAGLFKPKTNGHAVLATAPTMTTNRGE